MLELDYMEYATDELAQSAYVTSAGVGISWTERQPEGDQAEKWYENGAIANGGQKVFVGAETGRLWTSINGGVDWTERRPDGDQDHDYRQCVADDDLSFLVAPETDAGAGELWISSDSGATWANKSPAGLKNWNGTAVDSDGSVVMVCSGGFAGLYVSVNGGDNWTLHDPATGLSIACVGCDADGSVLLAGGYPGRLWLSENAGTDWAETRPDGDANHSWAKCDVSDDGEVLMAIDYGGRIWVSLDCGDNWLERRPIDDDDYNWGSIRCDSTGAKIIVSINGSRIWVSDDYGATWAETQPKGDVNGAWYGASISRDGDYVIATEQSGRVYTGLEVENLQSYSEATIKQQGSYSLKGVATDGALNTTLTKTLTGGDKIDLSDRDTLKVYFRTSRTGTNIQLQIHDSGGTTSNKDIVISSADTWEQTTWDISGINNANKDDIDSIIIKIINADSANTIYVDDFKALVATVTLDIINQYNLVKQELIDIDNEYRLSKENLIDIDNKYNIAMEGLLDYYTVLLLHCNGDDESTNFLDASPSHHEITAVGNVKIDTAYKKFGTGSASFDGTTAHLSIPDSDNFYFGSEDFTIDFWVRFNSFDNLPMGFCEQYHEFGEGDWWELFLSYEKKLAIRFEEGGVGTKAWYATQSALSISIETWYHIAVVRNGSSCYMFLDGVSQTLNEITSFGTKDLGDSPDNLTIGATYQLDPEDMDARLDEFRILKGIARWTSGFTPSTSEYKIFSDIDNKYNTTKAELLDIINQYNLVKESLFNIDNKYRLSEQELADISNKYNIAKEELLNIINKYSLNKLELENINNKFNTLIGILRNILNKYRLSKQELIDIDNKYRLTKKELIDIINKYSLAKESLFNVDNKYNTMKLVLSDINNKFNTEKLLLLDIINKFNSVIEVLSDENNKFNFASEILIDVDNELRDKKLILTDVNINFRMMAQWQIY